jgi:GNAT superfamily N-acetyltransferase
MDLSQPTTIRRAVDADASSLTRLMHASRAYDGPYRAILDGYALTPEQIARDEIHLASAADEVLGFYSLILQGHEPELDLLFVADRAHGSGFGKRLFEHMCGVARERGCRSVLIVSHPPAEPFYLRMGAIRTGTRPSSQRVPWPRPILHVSLG